MKKQLMPIDEQPTRNSVGRTGSRSRSYLVWSLLFATLLASQASFAQTTGHIYGPDEGDSYESPNTIHQLPYDRETYLQSRSDHDYFRFTAPANMKIRIRASGSFLNDPSCRLFSPNSTHVWIQKDNNGPGRDARIEFQAEGGREYIFSVTNRRSGPCQVMVDSPELVVNFENSLPENTYSKNPVGRAVSWARGNHFGSEYIFGYVKRQVEIRSYCLDRIVLDDVSMHLGGRNFYISRRYFSLPVVVDRSLNMEVGFNPTETGSLEDILELGYRINGSSQYTFARVAGIGSANTNASAFFGMRDHGPGSGTADSFADSDDAAHYHRFRAPVSGATWYRAMVFGIPKRSDRYDLVGTVFTNRLGSGNLAAPSGSGFIWTSEPIRRGQNVFVKAEIAPKEIDSYWFGPGDISFPARYSLHVIFIPM